MLFCDLCLVMFTVCNCVLFILNYINYTNATITKQPITETDPYAYSVLVIRIA